MATTYLSRTNASTTNRKTATFAGWVKRTVTGVDQFIFRANTGSNKFRFWFGTDDKLNINNQVGGVNQLQFEPDRRYRDVSAWYHIVIAIDTTQAVEANRFKLYINGAQQTDSSVTGGTYPSLNQDLEFNQNVANLIGAEDGPGSYFNGTMAHVHWIDGTQYAASDFGSTDATSGIWVPNTGPSVTYGTNGFFLKFASGALGDDSSGNNNDFTVSGTMTPTKDNAQNNFCTMNSLDNFYPAQTFTHGNTTIQSANKACPKGTIGLTSGKWYWEGKAIVTTSGTVWTIGISSWETINSTNDLGSRANEWSYYGSDGNSINSGSGTSYGDSYDTGDIVGIALDLTNSKLYFSKNGVWQNSGVPTSGGTGTGALSITAVGSTPLEAYFPAAGASSSSQNYTWSFNFGNGYFGTTIVSSSESDDAGIGSFEYDVPAGYYAICTNNLGDQS